ncbi:alpha/beta fold hydrolase [Anaerobacillus alkaliphilus]|uniref:Alpha/beta fold hydrolase n=1 Tax=Anaerobacillus alkaliphilus TaxID=1548597 RepID=A0A4Q0VRI7_9BACI|nr:alpha/beta fold hydrolase [Anaerobacillus alkaliphilus]
MVKQQFGLTSEDTEIKVGQTPKTAIWKKNKAVVWYYPAKERKFEVPLFLIYSLVSKPYILDLSHNSSMIQAFTKNGYDVYLLDFGVAGYEDKDLTLDDYISKYIKKAVQHTLRHSKANEITVVGYCLGGTLATIYAAVADEPIKNLILFVTPVDFQQLPLTASWRNMLKEERGTIEKIIDHYGIIPPTFIDKGIKLATSPLPIKPYLALLEHADNTQYVDRWKRFQKWTSDHVPFVGATLKQLIFDLALDNKLVNNELLINKTRVNLKNINANLLVVSTTDDDLVPEELTVSIMELVSSRDKTYQLEKGGHATLAIKGRLPKSLDDWLSERSIS